MVACLVFLLVFCLVPAQAAGPRKVPLGQPIRLTLEPLLPVMVTLPENVHHIWAVNEEDRISVEKLKQGGPFVGFKAFDPNYTGRIFVVGVSGTLYQFDIKTGNPGDIQVQVVAKPQETPKGKPQPFTIASFLRALYRGMALPEQVAVEMPAPAIPDARLLLGAIQSVALGETVGMLLPVTNATQVSLALDVQIGEAPKEPASADRIALGTWGFPPRYDILAIWAEEELLHAGGSTRIYVILRKRS